MVVYEGVVDSGFSYLFERFCSVVNTPHTGLGSGNSPWSESDTALETPYTAGGLERAYCGMEYLDTPEHPKTAHLYRSFTNNGTSELYIGEAGLYRYTGELVARKVFRPNELSNEGWLPPGESITIHWYLSFAFVDWTENELPLSGAAITLSVAASCVGTIDPSSFTTRFPLCFNGYEIPGAGIVSISEGRGGRTWSLTSTTTDYSKITALMRLAGSVAVGVSVSGDSYVTSLRRSGTFAIQQDYKTWVKYNNCYLVAPIVIETFGLNYWMTITIAQSAYGDLT